MKQAKKNRRSVWLMLEPLLPAVDSLAIGVAGLTSWLMVMLIRGHGGNWVWPPEYYEYLVLTVVIAGPGAMSWFGVYRSWRGTPLLHELRQAWVAWLLLFMGLAVLAFATKTGRAFSRMWMAGWLLNGFAFLTLFRVVVRRTLDRVRLSGYNRRRIVILGGEEIARRVITQLRKSPWVGIEIIGVFEDRDVGKHVQGVPVLGKLADTAGYFAETGKVDQVWIAMPLSAEARMRDVLTQLRHSTIDVCFVPDIYGFQLLNHSVSEIAGMPVLNLTASPLVGSSRLIKEVEDRLLGSLMLLAAFPLMLLIALAIKLNSPGPALFRQKRHGWDGKPINIYKFRTMYVHHEEGNQVTQAKKGDSRITSLGDFLRRSSLDELPQLLNVLDGSMSLVGPRPHAIQHNEQYKDMVDRYMLRHKVKPGITGWAQVNGYRGETDVISKMQKRVEFDLYYIENWSLWFDLKILLLTAFKGFFGNNAY